MLGNGIPILNFEDETGNLPDNELFKLGQYLKLLYKKRSFPQNNMNHFKLESLLQANNVYHANDLLFG